MHKHTTKEGETRVYKVRQDAYVPGAEERYLLIYIRLQEDYYWFSQELTQKILNPKNGFNSLFIEKRRNPQISSRSGPEFILTRLSVDRPVDRPKYVVDRPVDRKVLQHYRT